MFGYEMNNQGTKCVHNNLDGCVVFLLTMNNVTHKCYYVTSFLKVQRNKKHLLPIDIRLRLWFVN